MHLSILSFGAYLRQRRRVYSEASYELRQALPRMPTGLHTVFEVYGWLLLNANTEARAGAALAEKAWREVQAGDALATRTSAARATARLSENGSLPFSDTPHGVQKGSLPKRTKPARSRPSRRASPSTAGRRSRNPQVEA